MIVNQHDDRNIIFIPGPVDFTGKASSLIFRQQTLAVFRSKKGAVFLRIQHGGLNTVLRSEETLYPLSRPTVRAANIAAQVIDHRFAPACFCPFPSIACKHIIICAGNKAAEGNIGKTVFLYQAVIQRAEVNIKRLTLRPVKAIDFRFSRRIFQCDTALHGVLPQRKKRRLINNASVLQKRRLHADMFIGEATQCPPLPVIHHIIAAVDIL